MSKKYKLVYMLATQDNQGQMEPLPGYGEFNNRAAAREFVKERAYMFTGDIYLIRKETSIFFDRKLDVEDL